MRSLVRGLVFLVAAFMSVLTSGRATAEAPVPIVVCAIIGPEFQFVHLPANTSVVLEMNDACTLSQPSGSVAFSSSDALATLPSPLIYSAGDVIATGNGWLFAHTLVATFIFRSAGAQTLTVSVSGVPHVVGIVVDQPATQVPASSVLTVVFLAIVLCASGVHQRR